MIESNARLGVLTIAWDNLPHVLGCLPYGTVAVASRNIKNNAGEFLVIVPSLDPVLDAWPTPRLEVNGAGNLVQIWPENETEFLPYWDEWRKKNTRTSVEAEEEPKQETWRDRSPLL